MENAVRHGPEDKAGPAGSLSSPRTTQQLNIAFLVALAFAVAASANLPSIIYSLFRKRFNTRGATWSIYGGLLFSVGLVFFSPVVSGSETAMFPNADWQWFPLSNPGIISIPMGFFLGYLGTVTSREPASETAYPELEVGALTGRAPKAWSRTDRPHTEPSGGDRARGLRVVAGRMTGMWWLSRHVAPVTTCRTKTDRRTGRETT